MVQLREAEESGMIQRSTMSTSISLGFLAFAHGPFVGILDLPMFAADASSKESLAWLAPGRESCNQDHEALSS